MQTHTSNTLHNAIMEAGSKDRPPMLAHGNYAQWKSRIKGYIDTKPNLELIHHCLKNPPYKFTWADKEVPISEGSPVTRTESYMETYKTISQDIRNQLNVEAEVVQIILTGIDNDIYSTVDACPNACEMSKAIERLKQGESINPEWQRFVTLVKQSQELKTVTYHKLYDILKQHQNKVNEIRAERIARVANPLALVAQQQPVYNPQHHPTHYTQNSSTRSQQAATRNRGKAIEKEIDKLMALISLSFKKIYKPTNNNLQTSSNTSRANQDNSQRINRSIGYENQRIGNVVGARETVGSTVAQKFRIQCYNCKEFGHVVRECEKPKRRDDTDDELEDQELEAHYMYMVQLQEVSPDAADSGPIFDAKPLQKNDDDNDLANERELLGSLIEKLKCEIDDSKNRNKFLETSNKVLIEKLKDEVTNLQCDYLELLEKCECLEKELSKSKMMSKSFEALQKHAINLEIDLQQCQENIKKEKSFKVSQSKEFCKEREQYFEIQDLKSQLQDKGIVIRVIPKTSVSRPQLNSNPMGDRVMRNNSQGKKHDVEDQRRSVKFSKNKTSVTTCNDSLKAKTLNVNIVCATCGKCVLKEKHDMCVLKYVNGVHSRTKMPIVMPISTRDPKCTVKQSVAKPLKKTLASASNQKPRNINRKLYERVSKACSWWYLKFTPSGYKWKPKCSNVLNTSLSSNSFAARRDCPIHR
nr:hypothetical protein [Tanacetum cinerariifolium]